MTAAPGFLLSIHALLDEADSPWLAPGVSLRIVANPQLAFPIGPFAVALQPSGEFDAEPMPYTGRGPGWRGGGLVDGVAYLDIPRPPVDEDPGGPIMVQATGDIPDGVEISVVHAGGGTGLPIATLRAGDRVLCAPEIRRLRIVGQCRLDETVRVVYPSPRFIGSPARALGLPLGLVDSEPPGRPSYFGRDEDGAIAFDRVVTGAPSAVAPHEHPLRFDDPARPRPDPGDELRRVRAAVDPWLSGALRDQIARRYRQAGGMAEIAGPLTRSFAKPSTRVSASLDPMEAIQVAAADPGVARWLGLAATLMPESGERYLVVTVAGRWTRRRANNPSVPWLFAELFHDDLTVQAMLDDAGLNDQPQNLLGPQSRTYDLWAQAVVDRFALPEPPESPRLTAGEVGTWSSTGGRDAVRLPLTMQGAAPLGQVGIARLDAAGAVPVGSSLIESPVRRIRTLTAADGAAVGDLIVEPAADSARYRAWQADVFGRWSDPGSEATIPLPARPRLPRPEPVVTLGPDLEIPDGEVAVSATVRVSTRIPPRVPGQPEIRRVSVTVAGSSSHLDVTAGLSEAVLEVPGPALLRAETRNDEVLTTTFGGDPGVDPASAVLSLTFTDPRPPPPPPVPQVLKFTARPDASGSVKAFIDFPDGPGIEAWQVFMTTETRLRSRGIHGPAEAATRNDRAADWIGQAPSWDRQVFDCLTPTPVSASERRYLLSLPGSLDEVVFFRLVPRGPGGSAPAFASCKTIPMAVPHSIAPAAPVLQLATDVAAWPTQTVVITPAPGRVEADRYRIKVLPSDGGMRGGRVLRQGTLDPGDTRVELPGLRAFARVVLAAEVRGVSENGDPPAPGAWSPASTPLELVAKPPEPPSADTATSTSDGTLTTIEVSVSALPANPHPGKFRLWVFQRDTPGDSPIRVADMEILSPLTRVMTPQIKDATYLVVVVDPLGRASAHIDVTPM